jgi:predicted transcriptional regulator
MDDPLSLTSRKRIYEFITSRPGTFIREMEKELDMQPGLLAYHLDKLKKGGLVRSEDDGYRTRYFPAEGFLLKDRKTVGLLRQIQLRKIMLLVLEREMVCFQDLQVAIGVSKSTLSHHLKKLTRGEVLVAKKVDRETFYHATDPDFIIVLLIKLDDDKTMDAEDRFAEIWRNLRPR